MKKWVSLVLIALLGLTVFAGCGGDDKTVTVGASVTPHAEILKIAAEVLKEKGYTLEIKEFSDYVIPNTSVEDGSLDANYFQHTPYLEEFNETRGTHLVSVCDVHYEPFGVYPGKVSSFDDLKKGDIIGVPNDGTNEARALLLLEANGVITLKEGVGMAATKLDIVENPLELDIREMEAAQVPLSLQDMAMGVINGNYALQHDLSVSEDAIAKEELDSEAAQTYKNILVVKEGNQDNAAIKALAEALRSEKVKKFIEEKYAGSVIPTF